MTAPASRRVSLATGLDYHILEWGADDPSRDHTVLLVHGFLDMAWGWERTVHAGLGERFHIVAPDMRGHGDSDRVGAGGYYHFMDYVADIASLAGVVARGRLSLVGHSMGGSVAAYYTGAYPDRVHRLVLMEGTGPPEGSQDVPALVAGWVDSWRKARSGPNKVYASIGEAAARLRKNDPQLADDLAEELARHGTEPVDGGVRFKHDPLHLTRGPYPFRSDVAEQFWRRIRCPVLLIDGAKSRMSSAGDGRERRYRTFAHAERSVLDDAGHMMQRHQPAALSALLEDFLAR